MRRMRFPVELNPEESIPGALARGVRKNVLERSSIMFGDTGLPIRKGGLVQTMSAAELEIVAYWMRCDPALLVRQAARVGSASKIALGDLVLEPRDIQLQKRRIGPITLETQPFHRMAWLCALLPYCPVSLERMVDTCPRCEVALGWSRCWGVGYCERCRERVPPSAEPALCAELADDYRLFAAILSPVAEIRRQAIANLPERLHSVAPGSLVQMAIRLGQTCRDEPITNVRRESVKSLPPHVLADVAVRGTGFLRTWPKGFVGHTKAAFERSIGYLDAYHAVRRSVRRLGNAQIEDPAQAELVREALPTEFAAFARSAQSGECMTLLDTRAVTNLHPLQLAHVRSDLEARRLPGRKVTRSQFDADRFRDFGEKYRNSERIRHLTFRFMLPTYAVEQIICLDLLDAEDDELVRKVRGGACVTTGAADDLAARIRRKARATQKPGNAVSLVVASRRVGGREKPWGEIFKQLRDGDVEFWVEEEFPTVRNIFVHPASLAGFQHTVFQREDHCGFPFSAGYAKCEVEELLNQPPKRSKDLIERGDLTFSVNGGRHVADCDEVTRLAGRMASFAELSAHTGWRYHYALDETERLCVPRISVGWCREALVDRCLIPALPSYRPTFPARTPYSYQRPPKRGGVK